MRKLPGETWQWITAIAALVICFCLGIHLGRYIERGPESDYSAVPAESAGKLVDMPVSDPWAEKQERKIRAALKKEISLELTGMPFADFLDYFCVESNVNCHLDPVAEAAIQAMDHNSIQCKLSDVPLQTVLETVLHDRKLDWKIRNGVLVIVTQDAADEMLETRVYPVRDFGQAPRFRGPHAPPDPIIDVIQNSIDPSSWTSTGGVGSIERFPNADSLVITHNPSVHAQIAALLAQVRKSRQLQRQ